MRATWDWGYVAFDLLWVVLVAWFLLRLLKSGDPRWWLAVGAAVGLGMMTRYTMGVHVIALVLAVCLTPVRKHLRSPWLWAGAALALVILLPNIAPRRRTPHPAHRRHVPVLLVGV
ncbi:MAG: glycosyltransferase family 39 protein [Acidobacteria bacterium]|nr:glycosyltransferase family 39 protein [Acidobacteriota bacterium]